MKRIKKIKKKIKMKKMINKVVKVKINQNQKRIKANKYQIIIIIFKYNTNSNLLYQVFVKKLIAYVVELKALLISLVAFLNLNFHQAYLLRNCK